MFISQDRAVQDQELSLAFGLFPSPTTAHTVLRFPLEAVHSDICYDSTRSSSHQSKIAVIITQSVMRLTRQRHAAVQGSPNQSKSLSCSCSISSEGLLTPCRRGGASRVVNSVCGCLAGRVSGGRTML